MASLCRPEKCARLSGWKESQQRLDTDTKRGTGVSTGRESAVGVGGAGRRMEKTPGSLARTCSWGPPRQRAPGERWWGAPTADSQQQGPRRALANRGLWLVTHPGKPKALR